MMTHLSLCLLNTWPKPILYHLKRWSMHEMIQYISDILFEINTFFNYQPSSAKTTDNPFLL